MKKDNEKLKAVQKGIRESTKHSEYETFIPKSVRKKAKKVAKPKVSKVPKTRNNGKWTESQFWGFIRSTLRSKSRWWLPILECKKSARRAYKGENKRQKWEYLCNSCNLYFQEKFVSVDHVLPVGTLKCANDLPKFVENLFCSQENLQVLCKTCHDAKTKLDNNKTKENEN